MRSLAVAVLLPSESVENATKGERKCRAAVSEVGSQRHGDNRRRMQAFTD